MDQVTVTLLNEMVNVEWVGDDNNLKIKSNVTRFETINQTLEMAMLIIGDAEYSREIDGVLKAITIKGDNQWAWCEVHTSILSVNGKKPNKNWINSVFDKAGL